MVFAHVIRCSVVAVAAMGVLPRSAAKRPPIIIVEMLDFRTHTAIRGLVMPEKLLEGEETQALLLVA